MSTTAAEAEAAGSRAESGGGRGALRWAVRLGGLLCAAGLGLAACGPVGPDDGGYYAGPVYGGWDGGFLGGVWGGGWGWDHPGWGGWGRPGWGWHHPWVHHGFAGHGFAMHGGFAGHH